MRYLSAYRAMAAWMGPRARESGADGIFLRDPELRQEALRMLRTGRVYGAALCMFDREGILGTICAGHARKGLPVTPDTYFRVASVSKMVTAGIASALAFEKRLDLDMDVRSCLGIRAQGHPDIPISLRMLLSHTSSLRDTDLLEKAAQGMMLSEAGPRFAYTGAVPGSSFCYSNEGAALAGAVLETETGQDLDALLHRTYGPLGTYFPNRIKEGVLADAVRILPPRRAAYSGEAMQNAAGNETGSDPQRHWGRAHGSLCLRVNDAAEIAGQLMLDARFQQMFQPSVPFGSRDPSITEGLGMFLVRTPAGLICGHQGLAYGAAHGVFFSPETGRGFALLTSGCSLSRVHVLTDLNKAAISLLTEENRPWRK